MVGVKRVKKFRMFEGDSQSRPILGIGFLLGSIIDSVVHTSCQR